MRFGVSVGNLAPAEGNIEGCLSTARQAEALGFDSVWVHDHLAVPVRVDSRYPYRADGRSGLSTDRQYFEPLVLMSALAAITERVRIGVCVLAMPFRHPAVTAKMLATADLLSEGRITLGAGSGWMREEFEALGLPAEHFDRRGAVTDEYVRAVKEMWTNTGPSQFVGRFVSFSDIGTYPKPLQRPHPPIVIAGNGPAGMRRASRLGNGFQSTGVSPSELAVQVQQLRDICRADRRDPDELEVFFLGGMRFTQEPAPPGRPLLTGTVEQVAEELRAYAAAGLHHLIATPSAEGETDSEAARTRGLELMAREILPAFAEPRIAPAV